MRTKSKHLCFGNSDKVFLSRLCALHEDAYIKSGTFSTEIIWGKVSYVFPTKKNSDYTKFKEGLFLFNKVRGDAKAFLKSNPNFKLPREERSIMFQDSLPPKNAKICGTDLNHAYWRIASNLGVITNATYKKGLPKKFKSTRLAALSTLGAGRTFNIISSGKLTRQKVTFNENEELKRVYKLIRFTCFKYMKAIKKMLGNDFLAYKTDCIYYIDSKENRQMVSDYFTKNNLTFKQLI